MDSAKQILIRIVVVFGLFIGLVLITAGPEKAAEKALDGWGFVKKTATSLVVFVDKVVEGV